MPELISVSEIKLQWTDLETWQHRQPPANKRSSGIHLSGIIKYVLKSLKKLKSEDETDEMPTVVGMGLAFENWVVGLEDLKGMLWQPGEWEVDGVFGTPDGLSVLSGDHLLEEFKYTLKSEHTHGKDQQILSESIWMWQLAANCYALSEILGVPVEVARLHVYWACGDYRPPSPKLMRYLVRFKRKELEEFWGNVIMRNKGAEGVVREAH